MEVFPIGPAGRFFDAERCVYVRTVRFGFFFAQVTRVCVCLCVCLCCLSVCLSVARGARFLTMRCRRCWCYCYCLL